MLLHLQLDFSIIIPGFTTASFGTAQQTALCGAITNGWSSATSATTCTVGSVSSFNGTSVMASGYAYFTYGAVPTVTQLQTAAALRDARIVALTTNFTSVLGSVFPSAVPNCACNDLTAVIAPSTTAFVYNTNITGVPGPMQCGAKLTYDGSVNSLVNQVGIDNGSVTFGNLGKYCSTPAVAGGVLGVPGSGTCEQYGVQASAEGTSQATAEINEEYLDYYGFILEGAVVVKDGGSGYTTAPTVTISAPRPLAAQVTYTLTGFQPGAPTISSPNGPYSAAPVVTSLTNVCVDTANTGSFYGNKAYCQGAQVTYQVNGEPKTGALCVASDIVPPDMGKGGPAILGGLTFPQAEVLTRVIKATTIYCTQTPVITLSTNTLQPAVTALATATISGGKVTAINVVSPGSGYLSSPAPTVTISAPIANYVVQSLPHCCSSLLHCLRLCPNHHYHRCLPASRSRHLP